MTDYKALYAEKLISAEELAKQVESGWILGMDTAPSQAPAIMNAIAARVKSSDIKGVQVQTLLDAYPFEFYTDPDMFGKMTGYSWFSSGYARKAINGGWADLLPTYYRDIPRHIRAEYEYDAFCIEVSPMDSHGYKPEFAGAVEAAASTGGQIMPPIMGAAAFLMAEYVNLPYGEIALKAILPAFLYFAGIFVAVHLEAKKLGLKGLSRSEMVPGRELAVKSYLLIPIVLLIVLVSLNVYTMQKAAALSIIAAIIVGVINKDSRLTPAKFLEALEAGGKGTITVAVACSMAGVIAGCITVTGLASKLITAIVALSGNTLIIGLFLTMICCIILGMGVPTTANYCIMAATCAPILEKLGVPTVAAHFFVFYFGIVADITPPVALAAYAGSAIAKSNPMKTGVNATKLAIAAFIVPYVFAYSPSMLFIDVGSWVDIVTICLSAMLGIYGVAAGLNGFVKRKLNWLFRVLFIVGGLTLIIPGWKTDAIGLILVGGITAYEFIMAKKEQNEAMA